MSLTQEDDSNLKNHGMKLKTLIFECWIQGSVDPKKKRQGTDLSNVAILRTEGKAAEADKIEDISRFITAAYDSYDNECQFGLILDGSRFSRPISKVYSITISEQTDYAKSLKIRPAQSNYLTAKGNIAVDIHGIELNLTEDSPIFLIRIDLKLT